ncbi:hypothetical protein [Zhenhengia yiwuensis]|uniref:Uncharacterized protein n=1 Tax=Zhenhengia yiwuensis TaxID=2763666 RepID=A0A926ENV8_9FIRM|nr:hypothetical protein [Zhenhengia yiwuensis]MBC8581712.1 hypothetical protein [Zhenhengia yiwuensis]
MRIALYHLENILDKTNSILQQITDINPLILKQIILNCTEEYNQIISQNIGEFYTNNVENISYYSRDIEAVVTNNINIDKIPMDADDINKIVSCVSSAIISECYSQIKTGIVIAGYGEKEIFPSIYEYLIELKLGDSLKYTLVNKSEIGISVDEEKSDSAIMTFAQSEMAHTFVTGINPELEHKLKEEIINIVGPITERYEEVRNHLNLPVGELNEEQTNILKTLGDSIIHSIITELEEIQKEKHIHPFVQMVATLDKQQMAELAETLVSLTSFKRKMSMDTETVGGPIDVAIISKGEGFIWIKRKEYFDSKLNNHYFTKDCQYTRRDFND